MATSNDKQAPTKKLGRPRKSEGPRVNYPQLDQLLVMGEVIDPGDGGPAAVVFPSYRQLAQRFGVSHSVIADYARNHDCLRRRERATLRVQAKTEEKLIEQRASSFAVSKDDLLRIIDSYITAFEEAVRDGRVRIDNPADFNAMVRLREFVQGGADSRQEMQVALTLEDLQARHRQMLQSQEISNTAVRGEIQLERTVAGEQPSSGDASFDRRHLAEFRLLSGSEGLSDRAKVCGSRPRALAASLAKTNGDFLDDVAAGSGHNGHAIAVDERDDIEALLDAADHAARPRALAGPLAKTNGDFLDDVAASPGHNGHAIAVDEHGDGDAVLDAADHAARDPESILAFEPDEPDEPDGEHDA